MVTGRQEWTFRSHEDYDPNWIGAITETHVITALIEAGKRVYLPCVRTGRDDLVMGEADGRLYRVQCKTGHITHGAIFFPTQSLRAAKRESEWRRVAQDYQGAVDYFGVYCPDNGKVYLVPIAELPTRRGCHLRLDPPMNNQKRGIRWARDYEVNSGQRIPAELT
jgi:hypothetical protein